MGGGLLTAVVGEGKVFRSVDSEVDTAQEVGRGGLLITVGEFSSAHSVRR